MQAFEFDNRIVRSYEQFIRSFSNIRASDLRSQIGTAYDEEKFWPSPLLSLNPHYLNSKTIDDHVREGLLHRKTGDIFRTENGQSVTLYRHQEESISKAKNGLNFIVTSGTGSGKSLCFFIPIVDKIIRNRMEAKARTTKAIVIYPMNALANSQLKEINKFIESSGADLTVARFTGQENKRTREEIASNPPDILLTNYMMAELLLTRQDEVNKQVIANAKGLEFIVLDEFHTYRGRQGADVAVLVRRIRERCREGAEPLCIGTSATMIPDKAEGSKNKAIAEVAECLFGSKFTSDSIINESLRRATDDRLNLDWAKARLKDALENPLPEHVDDQTLRSHPLAVWIELAIGLDDGQHRERKKPIPFGKVVERLRLHSGVKEETCKEKLEEFLGRVCVPDDNPISEQGRSFLPFKLHRFVSNAGEIFTTLTKPDRPVFFDGQREVPGSSKERLYTTRFCGECGHEYHLVTKRAVNGKVQFISRTVDDSPIEDEDQEVAGYLCPIPSDSTEFQFDGAPESYPESWVRERKGSLEITPRWRKMKPAFMRIAPDGTESPSGNQFWFIPGKFRFCLCCKKEVVPGTFERNRLVGVSGGGRSSATTQLVTSALQLMEEQGKGVEDESSRKILGFTDNRQDAALQSGHFNDFIFVTLLRGGILRAISAAGNSGLGEEEFGFEVAKALGFTASNPETRSYWMRDPDAGIASQSDAERTLIKVLGFRVWNDLRRSWRYTNPNLFALKLIDIDFLGVEQLVADANRMKYVHPQLGKLDESQRATVVKTLFRAMVEGQAVDTELLQKTNLDTIGQKSRNVLRWPWVIDRIENERLRGKTSMVLRPVSGRPKLREAQAILRAGYQSRIAKQINKKELIGTRLSKSEYENFMQRLVEVLQNDFLTPFKLSDDDIAWRLKPSVVRLVQGNEIQTIQNEDLKRYPYFREQYQSVADDLGRGNSVLWKLEGREHTAQVTQWQREWREFRFRYGDDDRAKMKNHSHKLEVQQTGESDRFLPALFCSPTMELGIDISTLSTVYLRNVPPTPANYVQRAGRAGRSGQAASVLTYCSSQSPHDQYYFARKDEMVAGSVRLPTLDILNEELVNAHLQAVWLAETGLALEPDIPNNLILDGGG